MDKTDVEHRDWEGYSVETIVQVLWLDADSQVVVIRGPQLLRRFAQ